MKSNWSKISLLFFFLIASIGTILRAFPFFRFPLQYPHLLHAHSHMAFQGWIYTLMMLLICHLFLSKEQVQASRYPLQFKLTVGILIGILISFVLQGYGLFSITFSTLFQFLNYWFIYRFFKDSKTQAKNISLRFVRAGLWLGLLSTIGPYIIATLSAKGFANTEAYHSAIYFFMHFQYNAWFLFVAIGIFFKILEKEGIEYDLKKARFFFLTMAIAVIPAYSLSLLGMSYRSFVLAPSIFAVVLQVFGLAFLFLLLSPIRKRIQSAFNLWTRIFLQIAFTAFSLKIILQSLSLFPVFENLAFNNRNLIMAYMHLSLIGVVSFLLIAVLMYLKWIPEGKSSKTGSIFLLIGFIGTEFILVISGLGFPPFQDFLLFFSATMALGISLLLISRKSI